MGQGLGANEIQKRGPVSPIKFILAVCQSSKFQLQNLPQKRSVADELGTDEADRGHFKIFL